jgi:hypothetical protein
MFAYFPAPRPEFFCTAQKELNFLLVPAFPGPKGQPDAPKSGKFRAQTVANAGSASVS